MSLADGLSDVNATTLVGVFTVVGLFALWLLKKGYKGIQSFVHAVEIVTGKPAVGKSPAVPGIAERLSNIEYELKTNGGGSLRDVVSETNKLAITNGLNVETAKTLAITAAGKAEELAQAFAAADAEARRERAIQSQALDGLLSGLDDFAKTSHAKEVGYIRALKVSHNIDLTDIADEL